MKLMIDGFAFRLLIRKGDIALFEKAKPNGAKFFEVIRLRRRPAETIKGVSYPEREIMPRAEEFGVHGFAFSEIEEAEQSFHKLADSQAKERRSNRFRP